MESLMSLLELLNSLSPLAVIALLGVVIFILVSGKTSTDKKVDAIRGNDLHDFPVVAANLTQIMEILQRMEVKLVEDLSYVKARLNGGPRA